MSVHPNPSPSSDLKFEIGHVLFIDIVGYSKLLINEQSEQIQKLKEIVRGTEQVGLAEGEGKLLRLPTGDGGALVFRNNPEAPVLCAMAIANALKSYPKLRVRMGVHSGPVNEVTDLNEQANIAGAGINLAQRVMDCGDAGHILLSRHVAEDLQHYPRWQPYLHELGECAVKHGVRVGIVSLYNDEVGNPQLPKKLQVLKKHRARSRWSIIATALLLLAGVIAAFVIMARKSPRPVASFLEKSIAVLPLENLSEEKENAFFADGIQEELLSALGKIRDLKVISRTSVMQYKTGITRNLKEIAQQLGVGNVVEGSVRRSGNHIRVTVQLIDALTDRHIWSQNYDRTLADSLALQGELAKEIAAGVGATLSPQEKTRVEATPTKNTSAYDAYLRGRAFTAGLQSDRSNVEGAIRSYEEAVKLDPGFALAWVYLSCAQSIRYWVFDPSTARLAAAKDASDRALALDPNLPEAHLALGYYRYYGLRDFTGALAEFQQAEQGLPNNVDVLWALALIQRRLGHWEDALALLRRVVELDPRNTTAPIDLTFAYGNLRRFPEALASIDRLLAFEPTNRAALGIKATTLWAMGDLKAVEPLLANPGVHPVLRAVQALLQRRYPEAIDVLSKALAETPVDEQGIIPFMLALAQQRAGNAAAARAIYQKTSQDIQRALQTLPPDSAAEADLREHLSRAYAGLGQAESAIAEAQKAITLDPISKDPFEGAEREVAMAQIYALLGDADHAIPLIRRLLQIPVGLDITPAFLRLEPIWDPIRNDPRFQELCGEKQDKGGG